ncbi:hypothetical protein QBC34DRAFT_493423 [Podospora aff. communis PSN243]|uniref:F-box domain-containing protein n=1 Tax=Podospora aff. communis PSN243 TaxID=3040156 RepID=A0AAV9GRP0_9PEZI|nr:hypothetical protein QBC34DRAFT_493423 [Podospora aff. communis PSN243]
MACISGLWPFSILQSPGFNVLTTPLLDLPNELLDEIAAHLLPVLPKESRSHRRDSDLRAARVDCTDLLSLRQVSKRLSKSVTVALARTPQFQHPSIVMTEYTLETLCQIARDPDLGRVVKTLSISPYSIAFEKGLPVSRWRREKLPVSEEEYEQHLKFVKFGWASRRLAVALRALPNITTIFIHIPDDTRNVWGAKSLATCKVTITDSPNRWPSIVATFDRAFALLSQLSKTDKLGPPRYRDWYSKLNPGDPHRAFPCLAAAVIMAVGSSDIQLPSLVLDDNMADSSSALLPSLRYLEIMMPPIRASRYQQPHASFEWRQLWFRNLSEVLRLPQLRKLTLTDACGDADTFLPLILAHKKLEAVELRQLSVTWPMNGPAAGRIAHSEWQKIVTAIQTKTKVWILKISEGVELKGYPGYYREYYWKFEEVAGKDGGTERIIDPDSREPWNSEGDELWLTPRRKHGRWDGVHAREPRVGTVIDETPDVLILKKMNLVFGTN